MRKVELLPTRDCEAGNGPVYQWPPIFVKIGLDIGRVFEKCLIFEKNFLWFTYRLS